MTGTFTKVVVVVWVWAMLLFYAFDIFQYNIIVLAYLAVITLLLADVD